MESPKKAGFIRHRYVMCLLVSTGISFVYAMRVNMSVSIISIAGAQESGDSEAGTCVQKLPTTETTTTKAEFDWDESTRSLVLGSFFYGYISTQMLGGYMSDTLSIKWVFGTGIFLTSAFTTLSHWIIRWNVNAFAALRVMAGITEGVTIPAVYCLMSRWAPIDERTTMLTIALIGSNIGTIVTMPLTAALCSSSLGWPASFYLPGMAGVIWSVVWFFCATSQPENHRWISEEEKQYIIKNRAVLKAKKSTIPWFSILTSRPVWMFAMSRICNNVAFYMFLTEMPSFLASVFGISIEQNGLLNAFFSILYAVGYFISGALSDVLMKRRTLSTTNIRKLFDCFSLSVSGLLLIFVALARCEFGLVVFLLCAACFVSALVGGGNSATALDLAPAMAGSVVGFGNTIAHLAAIVATNLVAATADPSDIRAGWAASFYYTAAISFAGALLFGFFGSAEEQPWAKQEEDEIEIPDMERVYRYRLSIY